LISANAFLDYDGRKSPAPTLVYSGDHKTCDRSRRMSLAPPCDSV
jgi:hypothetical protein